MSFFRGVRSSGFELIFWLVFGLVKTPVRWNGLLFLFFEYFLHGFYLGYDYFRLNAKERLFDYNNLEFYTFPVRCLQNICEIHTIINAGLLLSENYVTLVTSSHLAITVA